ncbi:MAG: NUDIX hydrolase [Patescibacteria group bacterium]|nr:NUDIX hydrolase [Patescibacteria group bacterium]
MKILRPKSKQTMPGSARKVFSGEIYDVYQWPQKMFDGSTVTFERLKRPDTVSIIPVTQDGKIIVAYEEQPSLKPVTTTIAGRVELDEDILAAAKRELLEETGYQAPDWGLLHAYQPMTKTEWVIFTFVARGCKKVAEQNLDPGEKIKLKFVSFNKFIEMAARGDFGEHELKIMALEAKLDPKKMAKLKLNLQK